MGYCWSYSHHLPGDQTGPVTRETMDAGLHEMLFSGGTLHARLLGGAATARRLLVDELGGARGSRPLLSLDGRQDQQLCSVSCHSAQSQWQQFYLPPPLTRREGNADQSSQDPYMAGSIREAP